MILLIKTKPNHQRQTKNGIQQKKHIVGNHIKEITRRKKEVKFENGETL